MDIGVVWLAVRSERRRDADDDRVALAEPIKVGGGGELAASNRRGDALGPDMLDVRLAF